MRIIAGKCRGRTLCTPGRSSGKSEIRPTSDRVREALFSILGMRVKAAKVLDLYAGTGALGLEALSRGADAVVFVDLGELALNLIRKNVDLCRFSDRSTIVRRDLTRDRQFLQELRPQSGFDLIFLDPPYRYSLVEQFMDGLNSLELLAEDGLVVAEEDAGVELPLTFPGFILDDRRYYGDTGIWFYRPNSL